RSVKVDTLSGKIYVGGYNEFGYFRADPMGVLRYHSLMPYIVGDQLPTPEFIWKIHLLRDQVIFQSFNAIYVLQKGSIRTVPAQGGRFQFSFQVGDRILVQHTGRGLLEYRDQGFVPLKGSEAMN